MKSTPNSLRKHIGIFGDTNAGKSALFNKILNQEMAIVSDREGTTTDPVKKAMELIGFGPVVLVDTAGTNDSTGLGDLRHKKTYEMLRQMDYAIVLVDYKNFSKTTLSLLKDKLVKNGIPYTVVISKKDNLTDKEISEAKDEFENPIFVSVRDDKSVEELKNHLIERLKETEVKDRGLLEGIAESGDDIVLVVPIDSEAPKGRLIMPQVQTIRECLDIGAMCHVCRETELKDMLSKLDKVNLVITDSQAFKTVNEIVPESINLTSFSMLMARQKGDLDILYKGAEAIENLKDGDTVLISEVCTHNTSHEDIGRVKIPALLKKKTGKNLSFEFSSGFTFPEDVKKYGLVIHCGGCMITRKAMLSRMNILDEDDVPVTNFGVVLAYLTGAYERQKFLINT